MKIYGNIENRWGFIAKKFNEDAHYCRSESAVRLKWSDMKKKGNKKRKIRLYKGSRTKKRKISS